MVDAPCGTVAPASLQSCNNSNPSAELIPRNRMTTLRLDPNRANVTDLEALYNAANFTGFKLKLCRHNVNVNYVSLPTIQVGDSSDTIIAGVAPICRYMADETSNGPFAFNAFSNQWFEYVQNNLRPNILRIAVSLRLSVSFRRPWFREPSSKRQNQLLESRWH